MSDKMALEAEPIFTVKIEVEGETPMGPCQLVTLSLAEVKAKAVALYPSLTNRTFEILMYGQRTLRVRTEVQFGGNLPATLFTVLLLDDGPEDSGALMRDPIPGMQLGDVVSLAASLPKRQRPFDYGTGIGPPEVQSTTGSPNSPTCCGLKCYPRCNVIKK